MHYTRSETAERLNVLSRVGVLSCVYRTTTIIHIHDVQVNEHTLCVWWCVLFYLITPFEALCTQILIWQYKPWWHWLSPYLYPSFGRIKCRHWKLVLCFFILHCGIISGQFSIHSLLSCQPCAVFLEAPLTKTVPLLAMLMTSATAFTSLLFCLQDHLLSRIWDDSWGWAWVSSPEAQGKEGGMMGDSIFPQ